MRCATNLTRHRWQLPRWGTCVFLIASSCLAPMRARAEGPAVSYLFPTTVTIGVETEVQVKGTFANWPPQAWTSEPGLHVTPADESGKLTVAAAATCVPGLAWLRFYDETGASQVKAIGLTSFPSKLEATAAPPPNDTQVLDVPTVVHGRLAKNDEVDSYLVHAEQGHTLVARLDSHFDFQTPMDGVLQICTRDGVVLAQNDDARGLDPICTYQVPTAGDYLVRCFAFPASPNSAIRFAGGDDYVYALYVSTGPWVEYALPLAGRDDESTDYELVGWNLTQSRELLSARPLPHQRTSNLWQTGVLTTADGRGHVVPLTSWPLVVGSEDDDGSRRTIEIPSITSGYLSRADSAHEYEFEVAAGQKLEFLVESQSLGFELDSWVEVFDDSGTTVASNDDQKKALDSRLEHEFTNGGTYRVHIRDRFRHGGLRHAYRLTVRPATPDFLLELATGEHQTDVGKSLEVEVQVRRLGGCPWPIRVEARGIPGDATIVAESQPEGDSANSVKLTLPGSDTPSSLPWEIVGIVDDENQAIQDREVKATFATPHPQWRLSQCWLTVAAGAKP
ncbi:MAG: hypothetical protein KDA60_18165, partial [Planctomycetales bacterium]|nr:hypothetical protein [Planctomycetales bacterium]